MDYSEVYEQVESSTVFFSHGRRNNPYGVTLDSISTGVVVIDGFHVLTCAHCLSKNPTDIHYVISDLESNRIEQVSEFLLIDKENDIALLKFKNRVGSPVNILSSSSVKIGKECFVVGFPNSIMQKTLLSGHIASIGENHLLLDCSVNHGNSGGPLFDPEGNLIGIINAKHGGMNAVLKDLKDNHLAKRQGGVYISGIDPLAVFNEILESMNRNLNLGIGYAVKTDVIKEKIPHLF
ncbi:serine protease [Acinetobacter baumannii]|uniref:S1 family peptidase n=1 Tax=Acinetobacter TaxID=469 RepID=UPI00124FA8E0|nr:MULTISPECIES: serine protease [Acinetobacter]MDQ8996356.1 serine protease [Acinetobacter soli]